VISDVVSQRQRELAARREPFVTATVVKVTRPTSAVPGNVALVRADGSLEGFVGGVCAATSVRLYSLQALQSGEPLLLRILPDPEIEDPEALPVTEGQEIDREPGAVTVRNPCLSGGAIEVFLEPSLPAPCLIVAGDSPIADALAQLGPQLGLSLELGALPTGGELGLVVAAHGRNELEALRAAVDSQLPYIGLVASPKRGRAVLEELTEMGVDTSRVETPAGVDIGARTPEEIALSILARVVQTRRQRSGAGAGLSGPAPALTPPLSVIGPRFPAVSPTVTTVAAGVQTATDPICQMTVLVDADTPRSVRGGETYYFCCDGCQRSFEAQAA
jgi:xanthine dehydrogenase accessory factor